MNYHNITCPDMNNGNGLRVVLWLSGCSHYCKGCQNPQTWNPNSGILFDDKAEEELYEDIALPYISGITFSGGDPLFSNNQKEVLKICKKIRRLFGHTKTIWLYTGFTFEEICLNQKMNNIVELIDVLVDGEYKEELRDVDLPWVGSSNQRVIDVQKSLNNKTIVLLE